MRIRGFFIGTIPSLMQEKGDAVFIFVRRRGIIDPFPLTRYKRYCGTEGTMIEYTSCFEIA